LTPSRPFRRWQCATCGEIYDEAAGLPDEGIAPGTRFEDLPANWSCPNCGASKSTFRAIDQA
jgi:rubredoxin